MTTLSPVPDPPPADHTRAREAPFVRPIDPPADDPLDLALAWPTDRPLAALLDAGAPGRGWSILGIASDWTIVPGDAPEPDADPALALAALLPADLRRPLAAAAPPHAGGAGFDRADGDGPVPPFRRGWIGTLGYELGRTIEPAVRTTAHRPTSTPRLALARCDAAIAHHAGTGRWWTTGDHAAADRLLRAIDRRPASATDHGFATGAIVASLTPDAHLAAVRRALAYIRAGDVFQVNLARILEADFEGSARTFARRLLAAARAERAAILEIPGGPTIVSASPELFLDLDPRTRRVRTMPIKGTTPVDVPRAVLEHSAKDAAELAMIVDLMRNDLGRIATPGTVRVTEPRTLVDHATVRHAHAEVEAVIAPGTTVADLLEATFPCGSITGCPRIRAMQIIEELEPTPRGPYCGAIGAFDDDGTTQLNVAIRTATIEGTRPTNDFATINGILRYGAGGGIVADSNPDDELEETRAKSRILAQALDQPIH